MLGPIVKSEVKLSSLPLRYESAGDVHFSAGRFSLAEKCYCYALRLCVPSRPAFDRIANKHVDALSRMDE